MPEPKTQTSWIALLIIAIIAFGVLLAVRPGRGSMNQASPTGLETELTLSQSMDAGKTNKTTLTPPPTPTPTARTASAGSLPRRALP
jgi:hypothetical protein